MYTSSMYNERIVVHNPQYLLVGEHGPQRRAPVHASLALLRQPRLEQLQEDPLRPLHVLRVWGKNIRE